MSWFKDLLNKRLVTGTGTSPVLAEALRPEPAVSQEQFAPVEQRDTLVTQRRVVASANRNITRDYGNGPVDEESASRWAADGYANEDDYKELGLTVKPHDPSEDAAKDAMNGGRYTPDGYEIGRKLP